MSEEKYNEQNINTNDRTANIESTANSFSNLSSHPLAQARAWPVREALKVLQRINNINQKTGSKKTATFETGYSPSGLPHIGTIAEILRTLMVKKAFDILAEGKHASKLLSFIDDMDGLRKVPTNVPNQDLLKQHLGKPLTALPDPFGEYDSFATYNTTRLKNLLIALEHFNDVELCSATKFYNSGKFNAALLEVLKHHKKILDIMLPTLGEERRATYSPFLPISPKTGKVLQVAMKSYNVDEGTITFDDEDGTETTLPVTDGNCKLQFKPDMGMRWYALGVDYEIYGKDIIETAKLGYKICEILGGPRPDGMHYEHFLSPDGGRVSKSKGNENLTLDNWLDYTPKGCFEYFLFQDPSKARRMRIEDLPTYIDNFLQALKDYKNMTELEQMENGIYYVFDQDNLPVPADLDYRLVLSIACACHAPDIETLRGFLPTVKDSDKLSSDLIEKAFNYYKQEVKSKQQPQFIPSEMKVYVEKLIQLLKTADENLDALQDCFFRVGKESGKESGLSLGKWFEMLYLALLGTTQGPKLGTFCLMYGKQNVIDKLTEMNSK